MTEEKDAAGVNEETKKLYHIAFSFAEPRPGVITIPAENPDAAKALLMEMAKDMVNVQIHDIVDAATVPDLQAAIKQQMEATEQVIDDTEQEQVEKKVLN